MQTTVAVNPKATRRCKLVIIGAGASGLSCGHHVKSFLENDDETDINGQRNYIGDGDDEVVKEPIIILEARNRIGGRIHSVTKRIQNIRDNINDVKEFSVKESKCDEDSDCEYIVEDGAAWIHGTGEPFILNRKVDHQCLTENDEDETGCEHSESSSEDEMNPMVQLLQKVAERKGSGSYEKLLDFVTPLGNASTRPRTVLHAPLDLDISSISSIPRPNIPKGCQHVAIFKDGERIDPNSKIILDALEGYERIMLSVTELANSLVLNSEVKINDKTSIHNISVADAISSLPRDGNSNEDVESLIKFYIYILECWYSSSVSELQLYEFVGDGNFEDRPTGEEGDFPGPHCLVQTGMRSLLDPLLENGINDCILCNQEVIKVIRKSSKNGEKNKESVVVSTSSGLIVEADTCVITIPVGCLKDAVKSIEDNEKINQNNSLFDPSLSAEKIEAIHALSMGCYKKVFLTFSEIFWPVHEPYIGLIRQKPTDDDDSSWLGNILFIDNLWTRRSNKHGAMMMIPSFEVCLVGKAGDWSVSKSDEYIRDHILHFIQQTICLPPNLNNITELCIDCHITRWEEDPFSKGAYSGYVLGTQPRHSEALKQSEWNGRLIFAGEATCEDYEGSVHGALLSGMDASNQVISTLRKGR